MSGQVETIGRSCIYLECLLSLMVICTVAQTSVCDFPRLEDVDKTPNEHTILLRILFFQFLETLEYFQMEIGKRKYRQDRSLLKLECGSEQYLTFCARNSACVPPMSLETSRLQSLLRVREQAWGGVILGGFRGNTSRVVARVTALRRQEDVTRGSREGTGEGFVRRGEGMDGGGVGGSGR